MTMNSLFIYLIKSGAALMLLLGVYRLFLHKETHFMLNRVFLLLALIVSTILPWVPIPKIEASRAVSLFPVLSRWLLPAAPSLPDYEFTSGIEPAQSTSFDWSLLFLVLYLSVVAILLFRLVFHLLKIYRLAKHYGVQKASGYHLVWTKESFTPFSFLNLIFINKDHLVKKDFQKVIAHERVHIRQWHTFDLFLSELMIVLHWMNPFVWPYKRYLKETHEYLADAGVIAQGCDTAAYQMLIFEQTVGGRLFGFSNSFHQTQIKRRILMITRKKSKAQSMAKVLLATPVIAFLIGAYALTGVSKVSALPASVAPSMPGVTDASASDDEKEKIKKLEEEKKKQAAIEKKKEQAFAEQAAWDNLSEEEKLAKKKEEQAKWEALTAKEKMVALKEKMKKMDMERSSLKKSYAKLDLKIKDVEERGESTEKLKQKQAQIKATAAKLSEEMKNLELKMKTIKKAEKS